MGIAGTVIVFTMVWWLSFLAVSPLGHNPPAPGEKIVPGTDPGAPKDPRLGFKAQLATGITVAIVAALHIVMWLDFVQIPAIK